MGTDRLSNYLNGLKILWLRQVPPYSRWYDPKLDSHVINYTKNGTALKGVNFISKS